MALFGSQKPGGRDWGRTLATAFYGTQEMDRRDAKEQARIAGDRYRSDISPHDGPNGSGTGPAKTREEMLAALMQADANGLDVSGSARLYESMNPEPKFYNTTRGVVKVMPDGSAENIYDIPPDPPQASPGWNINTDGSWAPVKGGPYDPDYVRATAETRRQAVVKNPMPRAASAGGRGGSPRAATRGPWDRYR